jgi:hypothetical protein
MVANIQKWQSKHQELASAGTSEEEKSHLTIAPEHLVSHPLLSFWPLYPSSWGLLQVIDQLIDFLMCVTIPMSHRSLMKTILVISIA